MRLWVEFRVDVGTRFFWGVLLALAVASTFFGIKAEHQRRVVQRGHAGASVQQGDEVSLLRVIDADTLLVKTSEGQTVSIRLVGIKAFDQGLNRAGPIARIAAQAEQVLESLFLDRVATVHLNPISKDSRGRFLAHLSIAERDIGESLLSRGLVLVYSVYPFELSSRYLAEQEAARAAPRGLWQEPALALRANRLLVRWQKESE